MNSAPTGYPFYDLDVIKFLRKAAGASRVNKRKPRYDGERLASLAYEIGIGRGTLRNLLNQTLDEDGNPPVFSEKIHLKVIQWVSANGLSIYI